MTVNVLAGVANSVSGSGTGIAFADGTVINAAGVFGAAQGILAASGSVNVTNSGTINGSSNGVQAFVDATVINNAGGSIQGGTVGVWAVNGSANVTNSGSITSPGQVGISGRTYVTVVNNAGADISGAIYGVQASTAGGSSVYNAGSISGGTYAIRFAGSGNTLTLAPGSAITGNVFGSGSDTLQLGGSSGAATFDVSQIGTFAKYQNFTTFGKIDASTWTLTGTSAQSDAWSVAGGKLLVNGNLSSVNSFTVFAGATIGGTGTIGNTSVLGGTFAPGDGTSGSFTTVNGSLALSASSTYSVFVSPSTSSFATVSGDAQLYNAAVKATFANGSYIAKRYTILTYGSRVGSFGTLATTNLPANFTAGLSYDATHAYLDLLLGTPSFGSGLSGNQQGVANALVSYFTTTGGIPAVYGSLTANGLSQASGQPGASTAQSGINTTGQFLTTVFDNAFDQGGSGGPLGFAAANDNDDLSDYASKPKTKVAREAADAFARAMPVKALNPSFASRWSVWGAAYGGNSRISGDATAGTTTTTSRTFGMMAGANYLVSPSTQVGFALGGAGTSFGLDSALGGGKADVFNLAGFAKHTMGPAYVAAALGYSWQNTSTDRTVTIAAADRLHASFNAQALAARLEGGWRYATPLAGITPYAGVQTTAFYLPSYGETATSGSNAFALSYASKTVTATRGELGTKFDKAMLAQGGVFTLKAKTAWAHDWNTDRNATATFQALPGATFTVNGATPSADAALVSLGGEMNWMNGWTLAASFDGEFSRSTAGYAGKGSLRYAW